MICDPNQQSGGGITRISGNNDLFLKKATMRRVFRAADRNTLALLLFSP